MQAPPSNTAEALRQLGAGPDQLSDEDRKQLDEDGYLPIPNALAPGQVAALRARFDQLVQEEGDRAGLEVHQEPGTHRLADLVNKGEVFDPCWTHPKQLAAAAYVLGYRQMKLSSLNGRAAQPDAGNQPLHTDWSTPVQPSDYYVCNSIWMLDDFTADNGATRVVPGSHRWRRIPRESMDDPRHEHPDEVLVTGRAGTVVIFNAHLWHGGRLNHSTQLRRGLHGLFCRRDVGQQLVQRDYLRPETRRRLPEAALYLLDAGPQ